MTPTRRQITALSALAAAWLLAALIGGGVWIAGSGLGSGEHISDAGAGVLIVEETQDEAPHDGFPGYTRDQLDVMKSTDQASLRDLAQKHSATFLLLDKDDAVDQMPPVIQEVWGKDRPSLPWLYVWGKHRLKGAPVTTEAAALKLAKELIGD